MFVSSTLSDHVCDIHGSTGPPGAGGHGDRVDVGETAGGAEELRRHVATLTELAGSLAQLDRPARLALLACVGALRCYVDACEAELLALAHAERDDLAAGCRDIAQLAQRTMALARGDAVRRSRRATWLRELPAAHHAHRRGELSGPALDDLVGLAERLEPPLRAELLAEQSTLVAELAGLTPTQARRRLADWEHDHQPDDGGDRSAKQRRANRLTLGKRADGTTTGTFDLDPESAEQLRAAIDRRVGEIWRRRRTSDDPDNPREIDMARLRAEALVELVRDGARAPDATGTARAGYVEMLVLIDLPVLLAAIALAERNSDQTALDGLDITSPAAELLRAAAAGGRCELGDGTPITPARALALAGDARLIPVVLDSAGVPLFVGRASRIATPGQRSALRAVHSTCGVDECDVPFRYCEIHHIRWWRRRGRTDLDNLVPVCDHHHELVHLHGWTIHMDALRRVTLLPPPATELAACA